MVTTAKDNTNFPEPIDVRTPLKKEELNVLRLEYEKAQKLGLVPVQTKFNLGWGLVKSMDRKEIAQGITYMTEIFLNEEERRRECYYYLALGYYKLGQYDEARHFSNLILKDEPNNLQAKGLERLIQSDVRKEGLWGMALVGSAAAVGATVLYALVRGGKNR